MKKVILLLLTAMLFAGCSKENNEVVVTNLSGYDWYDTQLWYTNSKDAMEGYSEVGNVYIGETCSVETDCRYIIVSARDSRGNLIMSDHMDATNGFITVDRDDLLR